MSTEANLVLSHRIDTWVLFSTSQWEVWEHSPILFYLAKAIWARPFWKRGCIRASIMKCVSERKASSLRQTESGARENILRECCEILKTHLLGIEFLMMLNENVAVRLAALRRRGDAGGQWALLSKRRHVKNYNWIGFIKLYGCLMKPRAAWLGGISLQYYGKWVESLTASSFLFFFCFYCKHLIRCDS